MPFYARENVYQSHTSASWKLKYFGCLVYTKAVAGTEILQLELFRTAVYGFALDKCSFKPNVEVVIM